MVVLWNTITIENLCFSISLYFTIYYCEGKSEFSIAINPVFSVTEILQKSSSLIFFGEFSEKNKYLN